MKNSVNNIFVLGSVAFDEISTFPGRFADVLKADSFDKLSVSFVVENNRRSFGGCSGNFAYSLSLLGLSAWICGRIGVDGTSYRERLSRYGMRTEYLDIVPGMTAHAFITTDLEENQIAHFAPGVIGRDAGPFVLPKEAMPGDLLLVSPENPRRMKEAVLQGLKRGLRVIFDPGQQIHAFSARELEKLIQGPLALFFNEYEWELFKSKTGLSEKELKKKVKMVVVTQGDRGGFFLEQKGNMAHKKRFAPVFTKTVDPTGSGDAFRAGFIAGLVRGFSIDKCAELGALLGSACAAHFEPQGYLLSPSQARSLRTFGFSLRRSLG